MRILASCDWFSPSTGGGAERVAWEVYRRLAVAGHTVTVVGTVTDGDRFGSAGLGADFEVVVVRARDLSPLLRAQASLAWGLNAAFQRSLERMRPDVIHANSLQFQTTAVAARAAARAGVPLVVTAHIGSLEQVPGWVGLGARTHERLVGRRILRRATRAIAVSEAVRQHIEHLAPRLPVDVVGNGVDHTRFRPRVPEPTADHGHRPLRIGLIGRLVPNKGPETALRAFADLIARGASAELEVIGDGPLRGRLEGLARTLGLADRVRFMGHLPDPAEALRKLDVVVRPSLTEGMPLGLLEAMACDVTVVASDIPGNASLVRHEVTGLLVPPRDSTALATALYRLAQDPALRRALAANGRHEVAERSWDACASGSLASLEHAVEASTRRRAELGEVETDAAVVVSGS